MSITNSEPSGTDLPLHEVSADLPTKRALDVRPGTIGELVARRWLLIAAATLLGAAAAWAIASMQPKQYRASSVLAVAPSADAMSSSDVLRSVDTLDRRSIVATIAALASTPRIAGEALTAAGWKGGHHPSIETRVLPNTTLFYVDVMGDDPVRAAAIANALPQILNAQAVTIYKVYGVSEVSPAGVPRTPLYPRPARALLSGAVLGAIFGFALAIFLSRDSLRSA